jgi:hypothetical protein
VAPKVPAGQGRGCDVDAGEYVPMGERPEQKDVASPVVAPNEPAGHAAGEELPATQKLARGQVVHCAALTRPLVLE